MAALAAVQCIRQLRRENKRLLPLAFTPHKSFFSFPWSQTKTTPNAERQKELREIERETDRERREQASTMSNEIREGKAKVLLETEKNKVFYNKSQVVNRDISIAVIKTFIKKRKEELKNNEKHMRTRLAGGPKGKNRRKEKKEKKEMKENNKQEGEGMEVKKKDEKEAPPIKILEAMAASGLRAVRYALEIPEVGKVYANDLDARALKDMKRNVAHNGVEDKVEPLQTDARILMLQKPDEYDVIDLDPYGAPVTLLDSAVQSICDGGLLCVTATDMAVLCGNANESCWMKYGSYPVKGKFCHENALRILLHSLQSHASRYKKYIVPVLSMSVDFYVRVFVRVFVSAEKAKEGATRESYVFHCNGCHSFYFQPVGRMDDGGGKKGGKKFNAGFGPAVGQACENCGKRFKMAGPIWTNPIHDKSWIRDILQTIKNGGKEEFAIFDKVRGLITIIDEELLDVPLSIDVHDVTKTLRCAPPPAQDVRSAIANAGYRVSSSHDNPTGVKTDAPFPVFWDIMRCWVKEHPLTNPPKEDSPAFHILSKPPTVQAKFARVFKALSKAKMNKIARFTPNPESHWGPGTRAGRKKRPHSAQHFFKKDRDGKPNGQQHGGGNHATQQNNEEGNDAANVNAKKLKPSEDEANNKTATITTTDEKNI